MIPWTRPSSRRYEAMFSLVRPSHGPHKDHWLVTIPSVNGPYTLGPYDGAMSPEQVLLAIATEAVLTQNDTGSRCVGGG